MESCRASTHVHGLPSNFIAFNFWGQCEYMKLSFVSIKIIVNSTMLQSIATPVARADSALVRGITSKNNKLSELHMQFKLICYRHSYAKANNIKERWSIFVPQVILRKIMQHGSNVSGSQVPGIVHKVKHHYWLYICSSQKLYKLNNRSVW